MNNTVVNEKMKNIFCKAFSFETVDEEQSFLALGGKSIGVMQLQMEILKEFSVKIEFPKLYKLGSIQAIAEYIIEHSED